MTPPTTPAPEYWPPEDRRAVGAAVAFALVAALVGLAVQPAGPVSRRAEVCAAKQAAREERAALSAHRHYLLLVALTPGDAAPAAAGPAAVLPIVAAAGAKVSESSPWLAVRDAKGRPVPGPPPSPTVARMMADRLSVRWSGEWRRLELEVK